VTPKESQIIYENELKNPFHAFLNVTPWRHHSGHGQNFRGVTEISKGYLWVSLGSHLLFGPLENNCGKFFIRKVKQ